MKKNIDGLSMLVAVVAVGSAALILVLGVTMIGIGELELSSTSDKSNETLSLAEGCAEEALNQLRIDGSYNGGTLSIGNGSCIIGVESSGNDRTIVVTSTISVYTKKIQVEATKGTPNITINSWQEIAN